MAADEEKLDQNKDDMKETREMWQKISENRDQKIAFKNKVLGGAMKSFAKQNQEKQEEKEDASIHLERDKSIKSRVSADSVETKKTEQSIGRKEEIKETLQEKESLREKPQIIDRKALDSKPLDDIAPKQFEEENIKNETIEEDHTSFENSPDKEDVIEGEVLKSSGVSESMDEEIRSKTSNLVTKELKSLESDLKKTDNLMNDLNKSDETFFDVLEEAGISRRKFFVILFSVLLAVFFILFFVFGGFDIFKDLKNDDELVVEEPIIEESIDDDLTAFHLIDASYEFASEFSTFISDDYIYKYGNDSGIIASYVWGDEYNALLIDMVYYLDLVNKMQSIYSIDVYDLLETTTMRRKVLEEFLDEFKTLIFEAETSIAQIDIILGKYEIYNDDLDVKIAEYENAYFAALDSFKGAESYENLELFIEFSQDFSEIKAYYNAYKELRLMLSDTLVLLSPRYDDIVLNKEAIIKGIKVFDVPGSDVDVILPVSRSE